MFALCYGLVFVIPIGGADMPVVISVLNACTGTAVAMSGLAINNIALIVAGALVGAAGVTLSIAMSKAMNRPLLSVLAGGFGGSNSAAGAGEGLDYRAERLVSDGKSHMTCEVKTPHNSFPVEIPALGDHMIYPTLMAAAVGEHFGLTQTQIADGVLHFAPTKMRMNLLHRGDDITILNDTYNANPQSMRAAVEVLSSARGAYKVAVLGDMFELGPLAPALHAGVGDYLGKAGIDCLVAVGELARHIHDAAQAAGVPECYYCPTKAEARPVLDGVVRPHATILVKASRGMALEELVDYLLTITGEA